jgi:hypothetical protein
MDYKGFEGQSFISLGIIGFLIIISFFSCSSFLVYGQSETSFTTTDKFEIQSKNGSISFSNDGIYDEACLEEGMWSFMNLKFYNYQSEERLDLRVSAEDCEITIISGLIYNSTFAGDIVKGARLRYIVDGNGKQVFNLGLDPKGGDWGVIFDGSFKGETDGWSLSSNGSLTITEATGNVTLSYYGFPDSFVENKNGEDQIFSEHSVVVITTVVVVAIFFMAAVIRTRKRGLNNLGFDQLASRVYMKFMDCVWIGLGKF